MNIAWFNEALVPVDDVRIGAGNHGFLYGDVLFETLRVEGCRLFRPDRHLDRMRSGAGILGLELPWDDPWLLAAIRATVRENGIADGAVRMTVSSGEHGWTPDRTPGVPPTLLITARAEARDGERLQPLRLGRGGPHPCGGRPAVKGLGYQTLLLERRLARSRGWDDAVLCCGSAAVETTVGNLFAVLDGIVWTHPTEETCLPGIARQAVLELAAERGVPLVERAVDWDRLRTATEAFTTNVLRGVTPVASLEGTSLTCDLPGPITSALAVGFSELVRREAR